MQIHGFNTQLDNTNRAATLPQLEKLLGKYGQETITASIAATMPEPRQLTDRAATLYQWLAELKAGARLQYVGTTHIIKKFLSESVVLIDKVNAVTFGGIEVKLSEIVASQ